MNDVEDLARQLRDELSGGVDISAKGRALYATDGSNYRHVPIGIIHPHDEEDVLAALRVCAERNVPVLPRGAGTSLAGQTCNLAVVFDFSRHMNCVRQIDAEAEIAYVEPGCVLDSLRGAAKNQGLTFGPDPATHAYCTLGGMIGNNSCGVHSIRTGMTDRNVETLRIATSDGVVLRVGKTTPNDSRLLTNASGRTGEIYSRLNSLRERYGEAIRGRYPPIPRRVSGYNLPWLLPESGFDVGRSLVGSEGTCVTVLEAGVRLVREPKARCLLVLGFRNIAEAADAVPEIRASGCVGLEGFDSVLTTNMALKGMRLPGRSLLPEGGGWLVVEFAADSLVEAAAMASEARRHFGHHSVTGARLVTEVEEQHAIWATREAALAASVRVPGKPDAWEGWEDASVAPEMLGEYLRQLRGLCERYQFETALYGHFGDGCVHNRIPFDLRSTHGIGAFRGFVEEATELVLSLGGSVSGEHGDGQARGELLGRMFGPELIAAFREFKAIWDPSGIMNPGKLVDARPLDSDLRTGPDYQPARLRTRLLLREDDGDLAHATERCVGVGRCRRTDGGVMCPSYMVTREEQHSTRGRAHLLNEMLRGEVVRGGWSSQVVKEALDLCLSCKGCKVDCPVSVDMAAYKAEFLFHHYRRRIRPRAAYTLGMIRWWLLVASRAPRVFNWLARNSRLSGPLKWMAGVERARQIPSIAPYTLTGWFHSRRRQMDGRPRVILWPDTFTNFLAPWIGVAAVMTLEELGYCVAMPNQSACCGRPLYDWGLLDLAVRQLRGVVTALEDESGEGDPVIVLEPSCAAAFRDELPNLLGEDPRVSQVARRVRSLSEFVVGEGKSSRLPDLSSKRALVQVHCHQHAVLGFDADRTILDAMNLKYEILDSGCCGMAGAFGFERGRKYEVSVGAAERVLLPAVRAADGDTLIIADGFSCREQIRQGSGRRALHLAEVIQEGLRANEG